MTDDTTDNFDWGDLGEAWWRTAGKQCKSRGLREASEQQIRFACVKHSGASDKAAAKLAGYSGDDDTIKQSAHKAAKSTAVQTMLAYAAAEANASSPKIIDRTARAEHLSDLVNKTLDPATKIRAIETLNKMDETATALGRSSDTDGFGDWRSVREYLQTPGGAPAIVHLWVASGQTLANLPLLHDVHKAVIESDPALWERIAKNYAAPERAWLQKRLDTPDYQYEARVKLWREVGIELDPKNAGNPDAIPTTQNQMISTLTQNASLGAGG